jgi:D-glycero-D-manno-heptose 1,7-bisphosphate phosphatase
MRPLTDTRPKPMIEFHGKPFMQYTVEMLREQGFQRVLMLLGYLPGVVQDHFGDGSDLGIQIDYCVSRPDDLTGRRMSLAAERLDPYFMLLYCDNYWPLQMDRVWRRFRTIGAPAMVTVYANRDDYRPGKDAVRVGGDGYVEVHDRTRTAPGLHGVEISYAILPGSVVDLLPADDALFEEAIYPQLVARRELSAYVTDHRYYSVGSLDRLAETEGFFARHPAVILDRDGVLNRRPPKAEYVTRPAEFEWLPGAKDALRLFHEAGYRVIVVSNQAGIARGAMTEGDLAAIHEHMRAEAEEAGGSIDAIYHCPHGWDEGCDCRKPKPGMLFQAQREFSLDLSRTVFVGDDERDAEAADAAECVSAQVSDALSLLDVTRRMLDGALVA